MNLEELSAREDHDLILGRTLTAAWSTQIGRRVRLSRVERLAQQWFFHPWLEVIAARDTAREPRRFAREQFRYARSRSRVLPQYVLGSLLGSDVGWRLMRRFAFSVEPAVPSAGRLLIMPANQRVRIFDFGRQVVRAYQKEGFDKATLERDLGVRGRQAPGPFVPITDYDTEAGWIEEPLVDAVPLARCPPWVSRKRAELNAFRLLDDWVAREPRTPVPSHQYSTHLVDQLAAALRLVDSRFGTSFGDLVMPWTLALTHHGSRLSDLWVGMTHGDFQPGNILLPRHGGAPLLIDWEHAGERCFFYDRLVYRLETRWAGPNPARVEVFVGGEADPLMEPLPRDREWRRSAVAMFLLEDMLWFARESLSGPYRRASTGLDRYVARLPQLVAALRLESP